MKKRKSLASITLALAFFYSHTVQAQDPASPSKIEVGINFSSLTFSGQPALGAGGLAPGDGKSEAGFGGRFTFNLSKHVALEAEGTFFPHENFTDFRIGGRLLQGQLGLKAGKRFAKFGIFGKARPGLVTFSKVLTIVGTSTIDINGQPITFPVFDDRRKTYFSMDLGGVLEFYPSRRVLTRIDVGDTIIHYGKLPGFGFSPTSPSSSRTAHNLQVSAGIGFRLMSPQPGTTETSRQDQDDTKHRFEVGAQFSSLGFSQIERFFTTPIQPTIFPDFRDTMTLAGFGGRFTYNVTPNFSLEVQGDFYPKNNFFINNGRAGGRTLQGQAGVKAGKRFEKFGIFAKGRPGIISFSKAAAFDPTFGFPIFRQERKNYFSMDLGGVLEFYPSSRIVTRFDGGDTMIRYRATKLPTSFFPTVDSFHVPAETTHNFQFSAGVGFRF